MTKNNNKSGGDAFGFLEALFGACMGEDRKESKKAPGLSKAFTNFSKVMIPDQKEVTVFKQDLQQLRESRLYADPDKGIASQISKVSEDISGQRPPGFLEKLLGFLTDPVSPYARPLDEKNRSRTITSLNDYSDSSGENYFSSKAKEIAKNLGLRDEDGGPYKFASLAGAANEAGLKKEELITIANGLERQTTANVKNTLQPHQTRRDRTQSTDRTQSLRDGTQFGSFGKQSSSNQISQIPGLDGVVKSLQGNSSSPSRSNSLSPTPSRSNPPSPSRSNSLTPSQGSSFSKDDLRPSGNNKSLRPTSQPRGGSSSKAPAGGGR
jgi:hypothetical protein